MIRFTVVGGEFVLHCVVDGDKVWYGTVVVSFLADYFTQCVPEKVPSYGNSLPVLDLYPTAKQPTTCHQPPVSLPDGYPLYLPSEPPSKVDI